MHFDIKLSIIIPTWNSSAHIRHCLKSLDKLADAPFEVVLIDNGSLNYTAGQLPARFPSLPIREIPQPQNLGFAAASNFGAATALGEWLAFLNADAFPAPDWLAQFMAGLAQYPVAGAFGSLILQDKNPNLVDSAGDIYNMSGAARKGYGNYPINEVPNKPRRIFAPCAAAAFYRRDVFLEIGGFDEDFFSYFEDVDLGFRLNLYGYQCVFLPDARVRHVGSASTEKDSDFPLYHYHRNFIWSYVKNMPGILFWLCLPFHFLANVIFFLKYLKNGHGKVVCKAKIDALKGLGKMWKKRKKIQRERCASIGEINLLLDKNILAPYRIGRELRRYNREHADRLSSE
jgi:GT2 family glycosyltransferase